MQTKLFVGLSFFPENSFAKTIDNYRVRFDDKYQSAPYLYLPIVPPFEIEATEVKKLEQELIEELESFFFENLKHHQLKFTGLDVHEYKKKKILFLNPIVEDELSFCQESLVDICRSYVNDREKRMKDFKKTFLTIGRFQDPFELHSAIDLARREFQEVTSLPYASISLFRKNNGVWQREADLVGFDRPTDTFLQSSVVGL